MLAKEINILKQRETRKRGEEMKKRRKKDNLIQKDKKQCFTFMF